MQDPKPISDELHRSAVATGKVSNLEIEVAFGHIPDNRNLRRLNEAREALRAAGGLPG